VTTRAQVLDFLGSRNITPRHDSSNDDPRFTRNRIRREVMPLLTRAINPRAPSHLARLGAQARAYYSRLRRRARRLLHQAALPREGDTSLLDATRLAGADAEILQESLRLLWRSRGWPLGRMSADRWLELIQLCLGRRPEVHLPGGVIARRKLNIVQLIGPMVSSLG
jgi:tRNA(Ile)-lysidine synthase TilS/MesJ